MSTETPEADARDLAEDSAEWLSVLQNGSRQDCIVFVGWLKKSPEHVEAILRMMELDATLSLLLPQKSGRDIECEQPAIKSEALEGPVHPSAEEVDTYRRAIVQMLLQRRIDRHSAEDLFQELWLQVLEDNPFDVLTDAHRLSKYLYRAARERTVALRRDGLSWVGGHKPSSTGLWQAEELSPLEANLGHRQLARCVRDLMFRAPASPDRKVLESLFLCPTPSPGARRALNVAGSELEQVVWRARQRFAEIVNERGASLSDPNIRHAKEVQRAALYVAGALASRLEERAFELKMVLSPRCAAEVDIWRALKRGMVHVERRRGADLRTQSVTEPSQIGS